jgi:uncharacterized OsmC-like protein
LHLVGDLFEFYDDERNYKPYSYVMLSVNACVLANIFGLRLILIYFRISIFVYDCRVPVNDGWRSDSGTRTTV